MSLGVLSMTDFLKRARAKINVFLVSYGKARAASELARLGYYEEARQVMLRD